MAAYYGNTYQPTIEQAIENVPSTDTIKLLQDVSSKITLDKVIGIESGGFSTSTIAISPEASSYLFYSNNGALQSVNTTGVCDIVYNENGFAHITAISLSPDTSLATVGENVPLKAELSYEAGKPRLNDEVKLFWLTSNGNAIFNPNMPTGLEANVYSVTPGAYSVTVSLADESQYMAASEDLISNKVTVLYNGHYTPLKPSPPDNSPMDSSGNTDEFTPNSGINAGVSGYGAGFTTPGSQTVITDDNQTITFSQSENGSKAASTLDKKGNVTSSILTIPKSSLDSNVVKIDLGNNNGQKLLISGNSTESEKAPQLTINLPESDTFAKVILPMDQDSLLPGTVAMIMEEDGSYTVIPATSFNEINSTLTIPLTGLQKIVILNNAQSFRDENTAPQYAKETAAFVSARELMTGMGESTPKPFEFDGLTLRGQFATILYRLSGKPAASGAYPDGVIIGAWNADAARWAVSNGYMGQGGSRFNPQQEITRDQIITILYRMNGAPKANLSLLNKYSDANYISNEDFKNAMAWGIEKGIIGQGVTTLRPQSEASRAEIAAMMERIIQNLY